MSNPVEEKSSCYQLRNDLQITQQQRQFETIWIIKDPVSFAHFLFSEQEYFIAKLLDGKRSLSQVLHVWKDRFKSESLSQSQLEAFCQRLANDGLTMSRRIGEGATFAARSRSNFSRSISNAFRNPIAIRFRGINPEFLLDSLWPVNAFLFHPLVIAANLLIAIAVLVLMLGNVEDLAAKMPTIASLLSSTGILWLMATMGVIKILHEIGHGLACRKYGGECPEIGLMFLAFTPCLFCNVSDAWLFPSKWKRILVSAAGIYIEIILAAIFALVWFWTEPGWLNAMAFNVVLICSVNTILLNGNPLLRYDGYYILSDLVEVPNLGQRGGEAFGAVVRSMVNRKADFNGSRWLAVYGGASFVYRCFVIVSILGGIYFVLKSYDLQLLGWGIAVLTLFGVFSGTMQKFKQSRKNRRGGFQWNVPGTLIVLAIVAAIPVLLFMIPMPAHVWSAAVIELEKPTYIYAPRNGEVVSSAEIASDVQANSVIATMEDFGLEMEVEQLKGLHKQNVELLKQLKLREINEPHLAGQIRSVENSVEELRDQLSLLKRDLEQLTIHAPHEGKLLPAPRRRIPAASPNSDGREQLLWEGTPLDPENRGCFVARGDVLAVLGDPADRTLVAYVSENDIREVAIDAKVRIWFSQFPGETLEGRVLDVVKEDVTVTPQELINDQAVDSVADASGRARPIETPYRVLIDCSEVPETAFIGSTSRVRIEVPNRTIARRCAEFFERLVKTKI